MMYTNNNNNNFAFVCGVNTTNISALAGTTLEVGDLANGDVVLVNTENEVLADSNRTAAGEDFKIATRLLDESGVARLYYSPAFNMSNVTITTGKSTAAAQQVTTIGSNETSTNFLLPDATTNSLAVAEVGNSFYCLIEKQDNDEANRAGYAPAITAQVKLKHPSTGSLDTIGTVNVQLAEQLREAIRVNDQLEAATPSVAGSKYVSAKVNIAGMGTNDASLYSSSPGTATCTFGSRTVTLSTASNLISEVTDATAGGVYYLIGGDIYLASAYSGTTITLEHPFAGETGTYSSTATQSATSIGILSNADIDAVTGVGLQITGIAQHSFSVARERIHSESRFNVRFAKDGENVGAAITLTTAADEGLGSYEQVAYEEYHSFGQLGLRWVSDIPGQVRPGNATVDTNYGCIRLSEVRTENRGLVSGFTSRKQANIWIQLEADGTTEATGNGVQDVLLTQLNVSAGDVDRS